MIPHFKLMYRCSTLEKPLTADQNKIGPIILSRRILLITFEEKLTKAKQKRNCFYNIKVNLNNYHYVGRMSYRNLTKRIPSATDSNKNQNIQNGNIWHFKRPVFSRFSCFYSVMHKKWFANHVLGIRFRKETVTSTIKLLRISRLYCTVNFQRKRVFKSSKN